MRKWQKFSLLASIFGLVVLMSDGAVAKIGKTVRTTCKTARDNFQNSPHNFQNSPNNWQNSPNNWNSTNGCTTTTAIVWAIRFQDRMAPG